MQEVASYVRQPTSAHASVQRVSFLSFFITCLVSHANTRYHLKQRLCSPARRGQGRRLVGAYKGGPSLSSLQHNATLTRSHGVVVAEGTP